MIDKPTFLIQTGHHGRKRISKAVENAHLDGAILSPSDYKKDANKKLTKKLNAADKIAFFDPHFYLPGEVHRNDLNDYGYYDEFGGRDYSSGLLHDAYTRAEFCTAVVECQDDLGVNAYISPALYLESVSPAEIDDWADLTESFLEAVNTEGSAKPVFASLPVNGRQLNDDDQRRQLLNTVTSFDVEGFYISVEYSDRDIRLPLKGETNIKSYLDLMMSLKLNQYDIVAGHTHQIAHLLFVIGVDAIASGHYKNLRTFDTSRWVAPDDGEDTIRRTVARYYSDILLESIRPDNLVNEIVVDSSYDISDIRTNSPYEDDLFESSVPPSQAGWKKSGAAWEHYIWSCQQIANTYRGMNADTRFDTARKKIRYANAQYKKIKQEVDQHIDEIDPDFYGHWDEVLDEIQDSRKYDRVKKQI